MLEDAIRDALTTSLVEALETSFVSVEPSLEGPSERSALEAVVPFTGGLEGELRLRFEAPLAREVVASYLGEDASELPPETLADSIGELANVVCGCVLGLVAPNALVSIGRPAVGDAQPSAPESFVCFRADQGLVSVALRTHPC